MYIIKNKSITIKATRITINPCACDEYCVTIIVDEKITEEHYLLGSIFEGEKEIAEKFYKD